MMLGENIKFGTLIQVSFFIFFAEKIKIKNILKKNKKNPVKLDRTSKLPDFHQLPQQVCYARYQVPYYFW